MKSSTDTVSAVESGSDTRLAARLSEIGEHLAAGYFEEPDAPPIRRSARALRRYFERAAMPEWSGEPLYPCGGVSLPSREGVVEFSYWAGMTVNEARLNARIEAARNGEGEALRAAAQAVRAIYRVGSSIPPGRNLGGGGYTHSIIHYGRVLREGLAGYSERLERCAAANPDPRAADFYAAMRDVLAGLFALHARTRESIRHALAARSEWSQTGARLLAAFDQVPIRPARDFYEAIVAANWLWYVDGSDNFGRFDQDLAPYLAPPSPPVSTVSARFSGAEPTSHCTETEKSNLTRAEILELVRLVWRNVNAVPGWNVALGGSDGEGKPAYNTLTEVCLEAARGSRRPNLALRVRTDMPDAVWERAIDAIASGCGLPALYNEEGYLAALPTAFPGIGTDAVQYAFGGCTETMVHGCSNVGSIDGGLNLLAVLSRTIHDKLGAAADFNQFLTWAIEDIRAEIRQVIACVNIDQRLKAEQQPQPLRSLLVDDCLERGQDFNAGGARYNSGVINLAGIANVADSLCAIRELVFGGQITAAQMVAALETDFASNPQERQQGDRDILSRIRACPKFGNDDDRVDCLAAEVAEAAFDEVRRHRTWRGDAPFQPACIMFVTYADAGLAVAATPDGRRAGEPVADSIGPMQGRDRRGPTAMLRSVCKLPLHKATGTPILNIRLNPSLLKTREGRGQFKALVQTYFAMGGMQIQATVVDQQVLRDAIAHPERHGDLIVRIGGYSEYFNNLSTALKLAVLERTEHG